MTITLHETIKCLTNEQVALLYDVALDEVDEFRELALKEFNGTPHRVRPRERVVGLVLRKSGGTKHWWTAEEDAVLMARDRNGDYELTAPEAAAFFGVSVPSIYGHRFTLNGGDVRRNNLESQTKALETAIHNGEEWGRDEDLRVMEFAGSLLDLARELGRTYYAVANRRRLLRGLDREVPGQGA